MRIPFPKMILKGDYLFRVMNKGALKKNLICRFSLNSALVEDSKVELTIKEVDPCSIKKDKNVSKQFQVDFYTRPYCKECSNVIPMEELCTPC